MNNLIKAVSKKDIKLFETILNTSITDIDATIQIKDIPYTLLGYVTHHGWIEGINYLCTKGADVKRPIAIRKQAIILFMSRCTLKGSCFKSIVLEGSQS